ncbi:MAG: hypothetical protein OXD01_16035, partial [Gammaproteobacteria bacterium]|nr:hypothetical protein [Gammaproteobacteria bacterium]
MSDTAQRCGVRLRDRLGWNSGMSWLSATGRSLAQLTENIYKNRKKDLTSVGMFGKILTADRRPQTADRRPQTAD